MLYIDTASYTNPGGHEINEDSFCRGKDFFAVCDGLGGHVNGEDASRCAIEYLKNNARGNYGSDTIKSLLEGANAAVCEQAGGAKTTVAVLFAENGTFSYANVGDSRVYIFRDDKVLVMTKDHSVCRAAVDMGTMEFDEIRRSEDRSKLLKVLGNDTNLTIPKGYPPIQMQEGDAFLICSDGFWDYVLESEMEADLLKSDTPQKWLSFMLKRHITAAMNKGDNYTAICGMVRSKPDPVPAAAAAAAPQKRSSLLWIILIAVLAAVIAVTVIMITLSNSTPSEQESSVTSTSSESSEPGTVSGIYNETSEESEPVIESSEPSVTSEESTPLPESSVPSVTSEESSTPLPESSVPSVTSEESSTPLPESSVPSATSEESSTPLPESSVPDVTSGAAESNPADTSRPITSGIFPNLSPIFPNTQP